MKISANEKQLYFRSLLQKVAPIRIIKTSTSKLITLSLVLSIFFSAIAPMRVNAETGVTYTGSTVAGIIEDVINLPGISVNSDDPTVPVILSIDDGILRMTDTTGITFTGSDTGTILTFSGTVSDINNALATLTYRTLTPGAKTISATISPAGHVYYPGNGHLYEVVNHGSSLSWDAAQPLADARTSNGAAGYLATVTSQEENDYLLGKLSGDGWFGASDVTTEGDWKWVTGPEAGTSFWAGLGDGVAVDGLFSNWAADEPNDSGANEDCAQFYSDGSGWNDLPCDGDYLDYYVVEYGAPGDLPTAPESASFTVNVSGVTAATINIASCADLIGVYDNGTDNRYDNLTLTSNVDCTGETLTPMFTEQDTDFGYIGFRGDFDGNGFTLSNIDINEPTTNNVGLFAYSNEADFHDITVSGTVVGDYCLGSIVGSATNSNFNNVNSSVNLTGSGEIGGIVGCYDATSNATNELGSNSYSGTISSNSSDIGGIIGNFDANDDSAVEISENNSAGINVPDSANVGGIIGGAYTNERAQLTLDNNSITGPVVGYDTVGGLIGNAYNDTGDDAGITLQNNHITQDITSDERDEAGGLVGNAENIYVFKSSYSGNVLGYDDEVGGLIGESYSSTIIESSSHGTVEASDSFAGGLVGRNSETTISRSYSTANVMGDNRVGGLVGANGGYITDSYARGSVTATAGEVGGLAGRCGRDITNSYSTGIVSGAYDVGGLLGYSDGCDVVDSFWDTESSLNATSGGDEAGKTTAEMKDKATFTDTATLGLSTTWNFDTIWQVYATVNDGYPCLQWQDAGCTYDDNDGVPTIVEDAAPNAGDANDDGTPDSDQAHVSSFVNTVTGEYTVVELDETCSLSEVSASKEDSQTVLDSGYNYPSGLVRFSADCGTPGYTTSARVIIYGNSTDNFVLRKHNSNTSAYFSITSAVITKGIIGGKNVTWATYQITDGGVLDIDGAANGTIVDPVGLAALSVGTPNTGFAR